MNGASETGDFCQVLHPDPIFPDPIFPGLVLDCLNTLIFLLLGICFLRAVLKQPLG